MRRRWTRPPTTGSIDALSRASGVPVVLGAVDEDYRREALGRTGWIFTRWGRKLRPDPLRRLRLDRVPSQVLEQVDPLDVREIVGRSSIPAPLGVAPGRRSSWPPSSLDRAGGRRTSGALGRGRVGRRRAHRRPPLRAPRPRGRHHAAAGATRPMWWRLMGWLQWVLGLAAVVGLVWLVVLGVIGWLKLPEIDTPKVGPFPLPTLLLVGWARARLARRLAGAACSARVGARRRRRARRQPAADRDRATSATDQLVVPVREVLDRHRETRERLDAARRPDVTRPSG